MKPVSLALKVILHYASVRTWKVIKNSIKNAGFSDKGVMTCFNRKHAEFQSHTYLVSFQDSLSTALLWRPLKKKCKWQCQEEK